MAKSEKTEISAAKKDKNCENCACCADFATRKENGEKIAKLAPFYAVAVASVILALFCGAISLGMAIAFFSGNSVSLPGVLNMLLNATDRLVAPVAIGIFGMLASLAAFFAISKIKKSPDAGLLAQSKIYRVINVVALIISTFLGAIFTVYALAVALSTLFALQNGLPWGAYYLGQFLPALLIGAAFATSALFVGGFAKGKIKMLVLWLVPLIVAAVGFVLVAVAVGVKSHSDDASEIFGVSRQTTIRQDLRNYDYEDLLDF